MSRKIGYLVVCGCLMWLAGCGISITLPGGQPERCATPTGCASGSGTSGTGTSTGTSNPKGTTTPAPTTPGTTRPAPTEPRPPQAAKCKGDSECKAGQKCVTAGTGASVCEDVPCAELGRDDCRRVRGRCYLEWLGPDKYRCREPQHRCEKLEETSCGQETACQWEPGSCYCPELADCDCGGGPSSNCMPPPCKDLETCSQYCMDKFGCCAPYGWCLDVYPGCNLSQHAPKTCTSGPPCRILDKRNCDGIPAQCRWQGTAGEGSCVDK